MFDDNVDGEEREESKNKLPQVRRTSEGSGGDADHLHRSVSPHIVEDHLAASSIGDDNHALQFEVYSSLSTVFFGTNLEVWGASRPL